MTWVSDKATLTSALTTAGYTQIANNLTTKEASESKQNKSYSLILGKPDLTQVTNNKVVAVRLVRLEINFRQKNVSDYDSNCDSFESLQSTINALSPFVSFQTLTPPERWSEKVQATTAILEFYYGTRVY